MEVTEHSALLGDEAQHVREKQQQYSPATPSTSSLSGWRALPKRISSALVGTVRVVFATVVAPAHYLVACFLDEHGRFSPILPIVHLYRFLTPGKRRNNSRERSALKEKRLGSGSSSEDRDGQRNRPQRRPKRPPSIASSSTAVATDSELDEKNNKLAVLSTGARHARSTPSTTMSTGEEIAPARRSIRIKLHNDEMIKRRRQQQQEQDTQSKVSPEAAKEAVAASLKSPSSPSASKLTRFPRAPVPPRPLIPRRQPSYTMPHAVGAGAGGAHAPHQKTLILDLDETLIHSHSKGGRFAQGHMVEVKMSHSVGFGGTIIGPQIPILYYVHKRPYCDEFLRKVSKWYNLVIFTASVQEYADPVIDWLELERKYFSGRYYRQHCTYRNGAYIKDLAQVEPDLSQVMIVDNSPVSYVFHEDNAIPIEGWISDPTDNDLLNLLPLLEGLQYVADVRALLALRLGQPQVDAS